MAQYVHRYKTENPQCEEYKAYVERLPWNLNRFEKRRQKARRQSAVVRAGAQSFSFPNFSGDDERDYKKGKLS